MGLAVGWANGRYVQINARTDHRWGLRHSGKELLVGEHARGKPATLAVKLTVAAVLLYAREDAAAEWDLLAAFPRAEFPGSPVTIRVGKIGGTWTPHDHAAKGATGSCRVEWLKQY